MFKVINRNTKEVLYKSKSRILASCALDSLYQQAYCNGNLEAKYDIVTEQPTLRAVCFTEWLTYFYAAAH